MDVPKMSAKKHRAQSSKRRLILKCFIAIIVVLFMTYISPGPGKFQTESQLQNPQKLMEAHSLPQVAQSLPQEAHSLPQETHSLPHVSYSIPVETHSLPVETHSLPVDTHSLPVDTHSFPVDTHSLPNVPQLRDVCDGRRVHMYDMPKEFNTKLLELCDGELVDWIHFCKHCKNFGFGEKVNTTNEIFQKDWYGTDAYMLEVIFFKRMRHYPCLTTSPDNADIFFIPYFAGLDALPYLYNSTKRFDKQGYEVLAWLRSKAAKSWARYGGVDHFMIAGRTGWDFGTPSADGWGTWLFGLPGFENITFMELERRPWRSQEQAIPYPVGYHPSSAASLERWIERVRSSVRTALFSFSGALRPNLSIRGMLSNECVNATTECARLDCAKISCSHNPVPIYESLLTADFCLQPRGDTATRRSTIDSIVSGCIPVLFHEDSAEKQYIWHLPEDYKNFSVFIHEDCVTSGKCVVRDILKRIPQSEVLKKREKLISMIPSVVYRHPLASDFLQKDAFDLAIDGMLRKAAELKESSQNSIV